MKNREKLLNITINEKTIYAWINDILDKYKKEGGLIISAICVEKLCKVIEDIKKVKIKLEYDSIASIWEEGLLIPVRGGFIIHCNTLDSEGKKFYSFKRKTRETIVHELAHILAYDCNSSIPRLSVNLPEYVFHFIARELLVPKEALESEEISQRIKSNLSRIRLLKDFSKEFVVSHKIIADRLTTDLSFLKNTMFTFWRCKNNKGYRIQRSETNEQFYHCESKLSDELRELLPHYWRRRVYSEAWNEVVRETAIQGCPRHKFLQVKGKRKKRGG